jgi:hypothetical protein
VSGLAALNRPCYNNSGSLCYSGPVSIIGDRCYQHPDGSIEVVPKTPAFVIGERVVRPLIDGIYSLSLRSIQIIKNGAYFLDAALSNAFNLIPGVQASRQFEQCTTRRVFAKAIESNRENLPQISTTLVDGQVKAVQSHSRKKFRNAKEAKAYLKKELDTFDELQIFCKADESIQLIQDLKEPSGIQKQQLQEAYEQLQELADADALKNCERRVMELLDELHSEISQYSIAALDPLPNFISSLLNNSKEDYTFADLHLQAKKINELSRKMVPIYQMTNNPDALGKWIDIMLLSAERNVDDTNSLLETFQTSTHVFKSSTAAVFQRAQKNRLRKMARQYQMTSISPQDAVVIKDLLDNTGPQSLVTKYIYSVLELFPDDLSIIDGTLRDVGRVIIQSTAIQIVATPILLMTFQCLPTRIKHMLALSAGILVLMGIGSKIYHSR